jgi:hypothetical protein
MKNLKQKCALAALAVAGAVVGVATPAVAAAGPNDAGTNCHGVVVSYLSTSGMAPGQLHQDFGVSARDVQAQADLLCDL